MAGMIFNFETNPRYQKLIQKISTMRPEQRAILSSAAVDSAFGNEAMRSHLQGLIQKADLSNRSRALDLSQRRSDIAYELGRGRLDLAKQGADFNRKQNRFANIIGGLTIPVEGYFGYKQMQKDTAEAGKYKKLVDMLGAMG
jgi:hypothetical protein